MENIGVRLVFKEETQQPILEAQEYCLLYIGRIFSNSI